MINPDSLKYVVWKGCVVTALTEAYSFRNGKLYQRGYYLRSELGAMATQRNYLQGNDIVKQAYYLAECMIDLHKKDQVGLCFFEMDTIHYINDMELNTQLVRKFHALLRQKGITDMKEQLISDATNGRTSSIKEMQPHELAQLCTNIEGKSATPKKKLKVSDAVLKMRAKVIALLCEIGYTKEVQEMPAAAGEGKTVTMPDFERINELVKGLGANKKGKILNFLYEGELKEVLAQVEVIVRKQKEKTV